GPHGIAVGSRVRAERNVVEPDIRAGPARLAQRLEYHREMLRLARVGDVDDARRPEHVQAIARGREIRRRVEITRVALAHDHRQGLAVAALESLRVDDERAFALAQQPGLVEPADDVVEIVVVRALAAILEQRTVDVEPLVNRIEIPFRRVDERPPELERLGVAALQRDDAQPRPLRELGITVEAPLGFLVERVEIADLARHGAAGPRASRRRRVAARRRAAAPAPRTRDHRRGAAWLPGRTR